MNKRDHVVIVAVLLAVGYLADLLQIAGFTLPLGHVVDVAATVGFIWGLVLLIQNGTLFYNKDYRVLIVLALIGVSMGVVFKISNGPIFALRDMLVRWFGYKGAAPIFVEHLLSVFRHPEVIALPAFAVIYSVAFFNKPAKRLLDILKLFWVLVFIAYFVLQVFQFNLVSAMMRIISDILFGVMFFVFAWQVFKPAKPLTQ